MATLYISNKNGNMFSDTFYEEGAVGGGMKDIMSRLNRNRSNRSKVITNSKKKKNNKKKKKKNKKKTKKKKKKK